MDRNERGVWERRRFGRERSSKAENSLFEVKSIDIIIDKSYWEDL